MSYEDSCGGVVFTKKDNQRLYVIIKSIEGFYGFPKGHMEKNETEKETALREIKEEVGLDVEIIDGFKSFSEHPLPKKPNVMKRIVYFPCYYENQEITYQKEELLGAELMTYEEAIKVFQFEDSKQILTEMDEFLEKNNK